MSARRRTGRRFGVFAGSTPTTPVFRDSGPDAEVERPQVSGHERRRLVLFEPQLGTFVERAAPRHDRFFELVDAALQIVGHWCPFRAHSIIPGSSVPSLRGNRVNPTEARRIRIGIDRVDGGIHLRRGRWRY